MTWETTPTYDHRAWILDTADAEDRSAIDRLRRDSDVTVIDRVHLQSDGLRRLQPAPGPDLGAESTRWAFYPWRRTLIHLLGPQSFRRLRLDRNRNMITAAEQDKLGQLRIGVVGLSVGHVVAHTLAAEGLCGQLRLADFDELELSNLNRVPATVFDLGENKAAIAARRIAELDPYIDVEVISAGLTPYTIDDFLDGLDIVVEECDSLDMKALVRRAARARRLPVLMATSDRGLVDVERFDLEPQRPILHGLLDEAEIDELSNLSGPQKVARVLRIVDAAQGSARGAASMVEVGQTISTWPQLAGEVVLGATAVAEAVRRIGVGEPLRSGRIRIDVAHALDQLSDPPVPASVVTATDPAPSTQTLDDDVAAVVEAVRRAPSGGNAQPWHIERDRHSITVRLAPEHSATVDIGYRSSAVAVGAAMFNARVAAAARNMLGPIKWSAGEKNSLLTAVMHFAGDHDPALAALYPAMLDRETNRRTGNGEPIDAETAARLQAVATDEGANLRILQTKDQLDRAATILASTDRIRFLTAALHAEMITEVRWPGDPDPDTGIDVRSLELDPGETAALGILRRPEVMAHLADWDAGASLGASTRSRVLSSSALGIFTVTGQSLIDYARGGSAAQAVWIEAERSGLAVHPVTPLFIHARDERERVALSPPFAAELGSLATAFDELFEPALDEELVIVFRLAYAGATSVRSRRRSGPLSLR